MPILLLLSVFGVGPELTNRDNSTVDQRDLQILPSSENLNNMADLWFVSVLNQRPDGAGIGTFDEWNLSSHGRSWMQTRYFLNGHDLTDPARPGNPLIDLPPSFWKTLDYQSFWTNTPGFHFLIGDGPTHGAQARMAWGQSIHGPTVIPQGIFDRDTAVPFGATAVRRSVGDRRAAGLALRASGFDVRADFLQQTNVYPTLRSSFGKLVDAHNQRATFLLQAPRSTTRLPIDIVALAQLIDRDHAGAEYRFPVEQTLKQSSRTAAIYADLPVEFASGATLSIRTGLGARRDNHIASADYSYVTDISEEWLWQHRAIAPFDLQRFRIDKQMQLTLSKGSTLTSDLGLTYHRRHELDRSRLEATTFRNATGVDDQSVVLRDVTSSSDHEAIGKNWRLTLANPVPWFDHTNLRMGVDYSSMTTPSAAGVAFFSPFLGLSHTWHFSGGTFDVSGEHIPESLTSEVGDFLDRSQSSGRLYEWNDDGDFVPASSEKGRFLGSTGGWTHRRAEHLVRPSAEQVAARYVTPQLGPIKLIISASLRHLHNRFVVRLENEEKFYKKNQLSNIDSRTTGSDDADLTVYERTRFGNEVYVLQNAQRANTYLGSEIQLLSVGSRMWFVNLGLAGYWSWGAAPFGLFADRNDSGVIDEIDGDPNARVNQRGRLDNDRSFFIKLLAGLQPLDQLAITTALRYRDGEPMTRIVVAENLSQGPTALQSEPRGDPIPRFTFHMTLDVRLRYAPWGPGSPVVFVADIYNVLNSGTEISEDVQTGVDYRRSLEMMPGRGFLLSMEVLSL